MESREAAELLSLMRGTWPRLAQDEVANGLWLEDLTRCDRACALEAFRGLRDSLDHAPAWSVFREAHQSAFRRRGFDRPALTEAPWDPPTEADKARVHDLVADLKAQIQERKRVLDGRAPTPAAVPHRGSGTTDPLVPMLTYDQLTELGYSESRMAAGRGEIIDLPHTHPRV